MEFLQMIKGWIFDYVKDICLNLDSMIVCLLLEGNDVVGVVLVVVFVMKSKVLIDVICNVGVFLFEEVIGVLIVVVFMGMNNVWYLYVEMVDDFDFVQQKVELCMNVYVNNGGVDKCWFEMYVLVVFIIGKCYFCIKLYYDLLKNYQGMSVQ